VFAVVWLLFSAVGPDDLLRARRWMLDARTVELKRRIYPMSQDLGWKNVLVENKNFELSGSEWRESVAGCQSKGESPNRPFLY
jgi:hypothetical protein